MTGNSNTGMPHYKNSVASMKNWEPVYQSLFNVVITPPPSVDGWDYILEHINSIAGMETDQVPGAGVEQKYKGITRRFADALPGATTVDLAINFSVNLDDSNSMYVYKGIKKWCDLVWNPLTGARALKKDYTGGPITVSLYNRVGETTRQWIYPTVWPMTNINVMDLSYDSTEIFPLDMTWACDYYEDISR